MDEITLTKQKKKKQTSHWWLKPDGIYFSPRCRVRGSYDSKYFAMFLLAHAEVADINYIAAKSVLNLY